MLSELGYGGTSLEPGYHVENKKIPVLESFVEHRLSVFRKVILMQGSEALEVAAKQHYGFLGQLTGLGCVAVVEKAAEDKIVDIDPDGALPRRRIAAGAEIIHLFQRRERAYAGRGVERRGVGIMKADDVGCLAGRGYACPKGHEAAPHAETLDKAVVIAGLAYMQIKVAGIKTADVGLLDRQEIEVDAVIEPVAGVPAVLADAGFKVSGLAVVLAGYLVHAEASGYIGHGLKLLVHKSVEEDGA